MLPQTDRSGTLNAWVEGELPAVTLEADEIAAAEREFADAQLEDGSLLLDRDPDSGAVEKLTFDEMAGTFTIERVADVEPVLDWCKGRFNEGVANRFSEFRHIASLPPEVLDLWPLAHFGPNHGLPAQWYLKPEYHHLVLKAAHDPDFGGFRTAPGHFIRRGDRA
jgi:hypothetical protein